MEQPTNYVRTIRIPSSFPTSIKVVSKFNLSEFLRNYGIDPNVENFMLFSNGKKALESKDVAMEFLRLYKEIVENKEDRKFKTIQDIIEYTGRTKDERDFIWNLPSMEGSRKALELRNSEIGSIEFIVEGVANCSRCGSGRLGIIFKQTRSADEPTTIYYRCTKCSNSWKT